MDPVFQEEQKHLSEVYAKIEGIASDAVRKITALEQAALEDRAAMTDELSFDFEDFKFENYSEIEHVHQIIDGYNLSLDIASKRLARARKLLESPYFAKISLQFKPGAPARDVYIGNADMTDDDYDYLVVDWRAPVAEAYYNQDMGPTQYKVDKRTIHADLKLRRQFEVVRDSLKSYFDTTVAIQDPLLLKTLSNSRTDKLQAITTTIQKEQNLVVRHEDVAALIVRGIAGSGKTSVLMQRIAYLFYRNRESLSPEQVYLITPNPVFGRYIDGVLPQLGETNPHICTWGDVLQSLGAYGRGDADVEYSQLTQIDDCMEGLELAPSDFKNIEAGGQVIISSSKIHAFYKRLRSRGVAFGSHLGSCMQDELESRLEQAVKRASKSERFISEIEALGNDEQIELFGRQYAPGDDEERERFAVSYYRAKNREAFDAVSSFDWLRIDKIGQSLLGKPSLSATEWLYLKMSITGICDPDARYVMIDEAQDYSLSQIKCLARYFNRAHFIMLGDENQSIRPGRASFDDIARLFERERGQCRSLSLMTSYRSTPQITDLFSSLLPQEDRGRISSVQPDGASPKIIECVTDEEYRDALVRIAREMSSEDALSAVICNTHERANWVKRLLGEDIFQLSKDSSLPLSGIVVTALDLAKGLEFDNVLVADAQASEFSGDELSRHRLYTAISRATRKVCILSQGRLTPLLQRASD